jgi:hypothetical protein
MGFDDAVEALVTIARMASSSAAADDPCDVPRQMRLTVDEAVLAPFFHSHRNVA